MNNTAVLTICSFNYLSKALVLLNTYHANHPDHSLNIVIVDRKKPAFIIDDKINIIWAEDLLGEDFFKYAFCFDVIELNTNVKPSAMKLLLQKHDFVIYFDPDIQIFSPINVVLDSLKSASIVVTPHANTPILDGNKPDDADLLRFGSYNLGFIGISKCEETFQFLDWWSTRLLALGYYEPQLGLAVDQKWMDLAPSFFPNLSILHHKGLNIAFWNLYERQINKIGDKWFVNEIIPVIFVHFSSFSMKLPDVIAFKQTRHAPGSRVDFTLIAAEYVSMLEKYTDTERDNERYSFDYFEDGVYVNATLRRFYSTLKDELFPDKNPFASNSLVRQFGIKNRLINLNSKGNKRLSFKDLQNYGRQERLFLRMLKTALFILGPDKYFSFMRYIAHISSIRNQQQMFLPGQNKRNNT